MNAALPQIPLRRTQVWALRLTTLALWAAVGASAVFWALQLSSSPQGSAPLTPPPAIAAPQADALALALGAGGASPAAKPQASSGAQPLALQGLLAGQDSGGGAALIAIDGKPAKPYRVGAQVGPDLWLQSVTRHQALLGPALGGPNTVTLALPQRGGKP